MIMIIQNFPLPCFHWKAKITNVKIHSQYVKIKVLDILRVKKMHYIKSR